MKSRILLRRLVYTMIVFHVLSTVVCDQPASAQELSSKEAAVSKLQLELSFPATTQTATTGSIHVRYTLSSPALAHGPVCLLFDTLQPALQRSTDQVNSLHVGDADGEISLKSPFVEKGLDASYQAFQLLRGVHGTLHVEYDVPAANPITQRRGPHIDLQAAGGGLSGAFSSFLLIPKLEGKLDLTVHWILPANESAVSTFGNGDFNSATTMSALETALFLEGRVETYPSTLQQHGISFYALGLPNSDLVQIVDWSTKLYLAEVKAFQGDSAKPFRFFIRSYQGGPIMSGRADNGVFMLYLPQAVQPDPEQLHELIAHESVHALIKDLDDATDDEGDWYTEGTADYFAILIPHDSCIVDAHETLTAINREAALYYTNSLRNVPNKRLHQVTQLGRNSWTIPYGRGALYFADLEGKLASHHLNLRVVDLVNEVSHRVSAGAPADNSIWKSVLSVRVGAWAVADWEKMLSGSLLLPIAGSFGSSYKPLQASIGFFDLGFDLPTAISAGGRITRLHFDSQAYKAGLRNGDVITETLNLNPAYRDFDHPITILVARGRRHRGITFNPHVGAYPGMKWVLSEDVTLRSSVSKRCAPHAAGDHPPF